MKAFKHKKIVPPKFNLHKQNVGEKFGKFVELKNKNKLKEKTQFEMR